MLWSSAFISNEKGKSLYSSPVASLCVWRKGYSNLMRTRYNETEPPARQSNVPLRASAHPSASAAVRPRYPRGLSDLERVTHLDVTRLPTLPQRSEAVGKTRDPITEDNVRDIEHILAIDEIATFPPDVQARRRPAIEKCSL